ncbi:S1C family serine protease [Chloroflexus aggregans]|uniref:2-alkenal reductase n=1 Tax=Chloroflexus aggregans (strain MD-66 / DSM 9485) TaxID=326427 RepID=B8GA73_CHLAD|nr:trypsin-like peptidase domain-containing protein [Chloroflexus aggregans]ACL26448.1 2-alkenal reductase [Chloroflexus aggregans DSM 9485]
MSERTGRGRGIVLFIELFLLLVIAGAFVWTALVNDRRETVAVTPSPTPVTLTMPTIIPMTATDLEAQIAAVYREAGPSVVNITSRSISYDFFFNPVPRQGSGSGFFYDTAGHIVTNYHVVADADELQVTLADGRTVSAKIVGSDPSNDLAVIKVDLPADEIRPLPIGDSTQVYVGQFVLAIGNPFGLERTLTFGIISALGRVIESPNQRFIGEVIQSDVAINPGNSGGPLLDLSGRVIGVNSAILSPSGANAGIGFAISARTVQRVVPVLIREGRYPHPSLGVRLIELTPQRAALFERAGMNLPTKQGLLIAELIEGGPAARAGLRGPQQVVRVGNWILPVGGDIIVAINGRSITSSQELLVYLETETQVGETVQVTVIRDGRERIIPVTLAELSS